MEVGGTGQGSSLGTLSHASHQTSREFWAQLSSWPHLIGQSDPSPASLSAVNSDWGGGMEPAKCWLTHRMVSSCCSCWHSAQSSLLSAALETGGRKQEKQSPPPDRSSLAPLAIKLGGACPVGGSSPLYSPPVASAGDSVWLKPRLLPVPVRKVGQRWGVRECCPLPHGPPRSAVVAQGWGHMVGGLHSPDFPLHPATQAGDRVFWLLYVTAQGWAGPVFTQNREAQGEDSMPPCERCLGCKWATN